MIIKDNYAIAEHDRTQYVFMPGQMVDVELLKVREGEKVEIDKVVLIKIGDKLEIGQPHVKKAKITCTVVLHGRDKKIEGFKYEAKSRHRKNFGHKQHFTRLKVDSIELGENKVLAEAKTTATKGKKKKVAKKRASTSRSKILKKMTKTTSKKIVKKIAKKVPAKKSATRKVAKKAPSKRVSKRKVTKKAIKKSTEKATKK